MEFIGWRRYCKYKFFKGFINELKLQASLSLDLNKLSKL